MNRRGDMMDGHSNDAMQDAGADALDEEVEILPGGTVITNPKDVRYLRYLRERATANAPVAADEDHLAPGPVLPTFEDINSLEEAWHAEHAHNLALEDHVAELEARLSNLNSDPTHPGYSKKVQDLLDIISFRDANQISRLISCALAKDSRWVPLRDIEKYAGVKRQTLGDWIDIKLVRTVPVGGRVYVRWADVDDQKHLRQGPYHF